MFIWGRNNNHLFRQNHKKTYSLPQKLPMGPIKKCVGGYDFLLILTQKGQLLCYYQSALYKINNFRDIVDIATTDNMVVLVKEDGSAWIMEFNSQKITSGDIHPSKIHLNESVIRAYMNYSDIFLTTAQREVYHLRRNEWYETKTYTDPVQVSGLKGKAIIDIAPGYNNVYFLTQQGYLFTSQKLNPTNANKVPFNIKFKDISASNYFAGIAENKRLYIWGQYQGQIYQKPTEFGKLAKGFKKIILSCENGYAITEQGQAWVWGKNANGELGLSDYEPRVQPFPLITLQKDKIENIYIGEGYTVCQVLKQQSNQVSMIKTTATFTLKTDPEQTENIPKKKIEKRKQKSKEKLGYIQEKLKNNKQSQIFTNQFSNSKLSKPKTLEQKYYSIPSQGLKIGGKNASKNAQKTPRKQLVRNSHHSVSPCSQRSKSRSKSPMSKVFKPPSFDNFQSNNFHYSLNKKKQGLKSQRSQLNQIRKYPTMEFSYQPQEKNKKIADKEKSLRNKIKQLEEENHRLRDLMNLKDNIIVDITEKIKLLEEAIEEHQRTLTARDSVLDQYQKREKQYQIHIDQLEKHIDCLIKGKSKQIELNKQNDCFMNKIAQYEKSMMREREQYEHKMRIMEEQLKTYRSKDKENNIDYSWLQNSKATGSRTSNQAVTQSRPLEENDIKMNFIISRIEESKVRIAKSATKLYEMMQ